jgi:hypothetical protein
VGPAELREIVTDFPALRPLVATHPATDGPLLGWLSALGDPAVDQALLWRASRGTPAVSAPAAPIPVSLPPTAAVRPGTPVAAAVPNGTPGRRSRRPLIIAGVAVAVVALVAGVALATPALLGALTGGAASSGGGGRAASGDLAVLGVTAVDSAWQGGAKAAWRVDPVQAVTAAGVDGLEPAGYGGRTADTVALTSDASTASGAVLGVDAASGDTSWGGYTQESCFGVTADGRLRCWGGRMGYYPTELVSMESGDRFDIADSKKLGARIPNGQEDAYNWTTGVVGGVLMASWSESAGESFDTAAVPGYLARIGSAGSRLDWQVAYTTSADGLVGRLQHGILTVGSIAVASETGEALARQADGEPLRWVADAVLQGGTGNASVTAPDGTEVVRITDGALPVTTTALPPHPLRQVGESIESFEPATGAALWSTAVGLPEGVLAAYHDGLVAVAQQPDPGDVSFRIAVLQEATGALVWAGTVQDPAGSTTQVVPVFTADGSLLVESDGQAPGDYGQVQDEGRLTMFNATTGRQLWERWGLVAGGLRHAAASAPFAPEVEAFDGIVVDDLDGGFTMLVPAAHQAAAPSEPPSGLPACPDGMIAVSWTEYADGSILLCRVDGRYQAVFSDATRAGWQPSGLTLVPDGYVLDFGNGGRATVTLGGSAVTFEADGASRGYVATRAWTPSGGETGFTEPPADVKACPAGSWPLSLSTWQGGWLLVCGTGSAPVHLAWSDSELGAGEATAVEPEQGGYCGQAGALRVCGYAAPALVSFTDAGRVTQRSVAANWFPDTGSGGAGQGTGSYDVPAPDNTDADQVRYLVDILNSSSAARSQLNPAVADVSACRRVDKAIRTIRGVGQNRRILLASLDSTPVDRIPDGVALVGTLREALEASRDADDAWLDWAKSERANGCAHGSDSALYRTALAVNRRVDEPKNAFVGAWNTRIAPQYGVQRFERGGI